MDNFLGEVRIFAGNFAPKDWALCAGQSMSVQSFAALFSLLGSSYGGNGTTLFNLPNLQGVVPVGTGQSPGNTAYVVGQTGGSANSAVALNNLPLHSHNLVGDLADSTVASAAGNLLGGNARGATPQYYVPAPVVATNVKMSPKMIAPNGPGWSGTPASFSVVQPTIEVTYIIALTGIFPQRS